MLLGAFIVGLVVLGVYVLLKSKPEKTPRPGGSGHPYEDDKR